MSVTPVLNHKLYGPPDQLTVGALVHEGEQTTAIKGGQQTVFAGVTMRQENVLCFEYGLLGNVDRGCDFHRIKALQCGAMSVINAMNNASPRTQNSETDIRETQVFPDDGVVMKLRRWEVTLETQELRHDSEATPSNSSAAPEGEQR